MKLPLGPPLPPPSVPHEYADRWGSWRTGPPPKADLEQRLAPYTLFRRATGHNRGLYVWSTAGFDEWILRLRRGLQK